MQGQEQTLQKNMIISLFNELVICNLVKSKFKAFSLLVLIY